MLWLIPPPNINFHYLHLLHPPNKVLTAVLDNPVSRIYNILLMDILSLIVLCSALAIFPLIYGLHFHGLKTALFLHLPSCCHFCFNLNYELNTKHYVKKKNTLCFYSAAIPLLTALCF